MKTRPPPSNGGLRSTRTGGPRTLRHWSLSHAFSPSQGHISFEGKGYDVLFVRHTLNGLQNSLDSQAVERRGYGHSAAGVQLRISAGANPRDRSVSTSFSTRYRHSLHFSSLQTAVPTKNHRLDHPLQSRMEKCWKVPWGQDSALGLWGSPCPGTGLPDPQQGSRCPSAPGTSTPGLHGSCARMGACISEVLIHPEPQEEATLRAGCHSCKIKMLESAFPKCEKFQDRHSATSPGVPGPRDAGLAGP